MRLVKLIKFIDEQKQQGIFSQNMLLKNLDSSKPKPFFCRNGLVSLHFQTQGKKKIGGKIQNNQNMLFEQLLKSHLLFVQENCLCSLIKFWNLSFRFFLSFS